MSRIAFSGFRHLLRRLDFVYKKPKAISGKADKVAGGEVLETYRGKTRRNVLMWGQRETAVYYASWCSSAT
jgi:hypothetical protein